LRNPRVPLGEEYVQRRRDRLLGLASLIMTEIRDAVADDTQKSSPKWLKYNSMGCLASSAVDPGRICFITVYTNVLEATQIG
jgi:hypothetical protein